MFRSRLHERRGLDSIPGATPELRAIHDTLSLVPLDQESIRSQFPILIETDGRRRFAFLDNAASTQQPEAVIEAVSRYHRQSHANIHRAVYGLSRAATEAYEQARTRIAAFINAGEAPECIFTRGTTEAINLVAASWGHANLRPGDEILLSVMEHHSNIVPWQIAAQSTGARIRVLPMLDSGELDLDAYHRLLSERTRIVAITHVSNALGTLNPVRELVGAAHAVGALILIDGAQWVAHGQTDVQDLDADFYAFSGHKLYGPTGIGVLYGKRELLEQMPPYQGGGDMIEEVSFSGTTYAGLPNRFEAGTPNISGAIGLGAAIEWLGAIGMEDIHAHEQALLRFATEQLQRVPGLEIMGTARHKSGVISFVLTDPAVSTLDVGTELDLDGVCVRTGHHCCQPLMERLGLGSTARASIGVYNDRQDIEQLSAALCRLVASRSAARDLEHRSEARGSERPAAAEQVSPASPDPIYPASAAESVSAAAAELQEQFELLPDWPTRHEYLIELGATLPGMPDRLKTSATRVHGCQSTVHMLARRRPGTDEIVEFIADSDAEIVRGLIAVLQRLYSGQQASEILAFDADAFFRRLGLDRNLSLSRRNGLASLLQRLRGFAKNCLQATTPVA
jgi:cysteine desulfurase/selenocysteine lyase